MTTQQLQQNDAEADPESSGGNGCSLCDLLCCVFEVFGAVASSL
eukprot:CAMPEP_0194254520 /NCGR_PEP_ID=MMETSP0158-20130606/32347_1 /TAXON_ID=33649 /ORGANISM="Thalassionema nitzschioides, Strain L26-B" /LENGTH=43 /DNA_ID= /DNA_START= /DNA_END= /DNA_ORIENTATION=